MASYAEAIVQFLAPFQGEMIEAGNFFGMVGLAQILNPSLPELNVVRVGDLKRDRVSGEPLAPDSINGFHAFHRVVTRREFVCREFPGNHIGKNQVGQGAGPVLQVANVSVLERGGEVVRPLGDLENMACRVRF